MKLPEEERQCCNVGAGMVIPEATSSVQRWFFHFNIDGFLDSFLKPSVFSVQNVDITVLGVPFPSDVGALLGLDLKRWLSYVVPVPVEPLLGLSYIEVQSHIPVTVYQDNPQTC